MKRVMRDVAAILTIVFLTGCGSDTPTFSLLPTQNTFLQEGGDAVNNKIDILWVVDNSGSMQTSQQHLADNFNSFISGFVDKGYDYQMAVTTTDAYKAIFAANPEYSRFRDGIGSIGDSGYNSNPHTGVYVINKETPDIINTFLTNMLQGINGSPDERAFQSFKEALSNNLNSGFLRSDAFLSIVIISDEDDFSHNTSANKGWQYGYSGLHTVQSYVDWLDGFTNSTVDRRTYNVNAIFIQDQDCADTLVGGWFSNNYRYAEIADLTDGIKADICGDFANELQVISDKIVQLSTQFYLNRLPVPETIQVKINGQTIDQKTTGPNGWLYNADANSIVFYGSAVPPQGAIIDVNFDPATLIE